MSSLETASIVHLCSLSDWEKAKEVGVYQADSLALDGFIHCSTSAQILGTANRYYSGRRDLVILWIEPTLLTAPVRWEASDAGIYPHVYGPINLEAVSTVLDFLPDADGKFRNIPGLPSD